MSTVTPDIVKSATTETEWARALREGLDRHGPTPIWDDMVREYGVPAAAAS